MMNFSLNHPILGLMILTMALGLGCASSAAVPTEAPTADSTGGAVPTVAAGAATAEPQVIPPGAPESSPGLSPERGVTPPAATDREAEAQSPATAIPGTVAMPLEGSLDPPTPPTVAETIPAGNTGPSEFAAGEATPTPGKQVVPQGSAANESAPTPPETVAPASAPSIGDVAAGGVETVPEPVEIPVGVTVGERPPDFAILLADGSTVASQELALQGKPAFLMFFATW